MTKRFARAYAALAACILAFAAAIAAPATPPRPFLPDLFDPRHRVVAPGLESVKTIRFLTTDDYP
ncbi:MAG: hypothetical protein INR64_15570, partial [Caulobacteraceae bacterium]|nr:hypothetical protein [Caulobacter sp.]